MGKMRKKNKFERPIPTGLKSVKDIIAEETANGSDSHNATLLSAIEKLQSGVLADRECGAEMLALIACNKDAVEELLKQNVVRIAAPLLLDASPTVRHSVAGSLRNLTAFGGYSVCEHFVEKDVLTPIVHLYQKFYQDWRPASPKEGQIDSSTEIFIETTNLLWNLCENSEQAVSVFNSCNLLTILVPCLKVSVFGSRVALVSAQCLQTVTENNLDLLSHISLENFKSLVVDLLSLEGSQPVTYHLRSLAAGIFINLNDGRLAGCSEESLAKFFDVLSTTLNVSLNETVQSYKDNDDNMNCSDKPNQDPISDLKNDGEDLARSHILTMLSAKQVALEVLTNVCCDDDGADDWESLRSSEASDDADVPMEEDSPDETGMMLLPDEIKAAILKLKLLETVEEHAFVSEETATQLAAVKNCRETLERLRTMQCRALLCLHNMVTGGIEMEAAGHLHQLWVKLAQLVLATAGQDQSELLEASTGCLRAVVQRLADQQALSSVAHLTLEDLSALYGVAQGCPDAKVRVNILRVVAIVGVLLQSDKSPQQNPFIASIGKFLVELSLKDEDIWVNSEAADAVMDVFSEDHLDSVAQQIMLVQKCKHILGNLKAKARQYQKQDGEHLPMVAMTKRNLSRFIKYKSKLTSNGHG